MRSALICVFFALIVQKGSRAASDDDFRPTPIPLKEWRPEKQDMAGTLHETIKTETPPTVAAVPAHYWEDALRHSVYLTLVRDKIDQLISKGVVISPEDKTNKEHSKEVDDHDLWEKIKSAPFDRLKDNTSPAGDVSILAKGRLFEENGGFRFAEGDLSQNKCGGNSCTKPVKAFWSVKRVRQRDAEPSTGKYHYELTFSVTSQTPQKLKKPFESPVRTFTIRENAPTNPPPVHRREIFHRPPTRPQRAIWVHKNIGPTYNHRVHQGTSDLDRLFTSLFSDEDSFEEPPRYKPNTYVPQMYPQYSKLGYVGNRDPFHQRNMPFTAKPQTYKYSRPMLPPPFVQHPYVDVETYVNGPPLPPHADTKFISNSIKTTRPAVLPTPLTPPSLLKESTIDTPIKTLPNTTDFSTKPPEAISTYKMHKPKLPATKISYSPGHVRPPVYNAPPGVFVTMDKKPFKPLPPLKLAHTPKLSSKTVPLDFRPSPQILDGQFVDPDSVPDSAFRPIAMNSNEDKNIIHNGDKKNIRKPSPSKKPTKKPDRTKSQRVTTVTPEIITAQENNDYDIEWTSILGAFSKTTPMASQKEKAIATESTTEAGTTTVAPETTSHEDSKETDIDYKITKPIQTTTPMPKKRTRPPPKFKQQKLNKHKRVSTTTSTTTIKSPKKFTVTNPTEDLTPQASSAPTSGANSVWEAKNKTVTIKLTTSTYTNETLTTTRPTTTTYLTTSSSTSRTITETQPTIATTQMRSKNRFRQSTLMHKGTSVNHDKWSSPTLEKNRTISLSDKFGMRRKVSKFHGYISSTTPKVTDEVRNQEDHKDHAFKPNLEFSSTESSNENNTTDKVSTSSQISIDEYEVSNDTESDSLETEQGKKTEEETAGNDEKIEYTHESKDDSEFIFPVSTTTENISIVSNKSNDMPIIESTTVSSEQLAPKNKTKCKKKKHNNVSTTVETPKISSAVFDITTITTSTEKVSTPDILEELFGGFTMGDDEEEKPKPSPLATDVDSNESESINYERYIGDDSVERFLESLEAKENLETDSDEHVDSQYDERGDESHETSPFDNEESSEEESEPRDAHYDDDYYDDGESQGSRPYSILELMAME